MVATVNTSLFGSAVLSAPRASVVARVMSDAMLRCHLRVVQAGGRELRALTPRPLDGLRVSTNFYHATWHLITAPHHAGTLRRLLWALAFDLHRDTAVVLDRPLIVPTPFDSAPSMPVVFVCSDRAHLTEDDIRAMVRGVRTQSSDCTVKLQTFGLSQFDASTKEERYATLDRLRYDTEERDIHVESRGGAIVFSMSSALLRLCAARMDSISTPIRADDSDQEYFGDGWPPAGEIQVFGGYQGMLRDAVVARAAVHAREPVAAMHPAVLSDVIADHRAELTRKRLKRERRVRTRRARQPR